MRHTFLFEPGLWIANGIFLDEQNQQMRLTGEAHITHQTDLWLNESCMRLDAQPGVEIKNSYQIIPFAEGKDFTTWKSYNAELGILIGQFIIVSNTIISSYHSPDSFHRGTECLIMLDSYCYESKGFLFSGDGKVSSWSVNLSRA